MKILHCADWHLRDRDIDEVDKCLTFLTESAKTEAVDLIVIAGDIFHSQDVKLDSLSAKLAVKTVSALADIAPVAIVIGTPSHDGKAPEILRFARGKYDVYVTAFPHQVYLEDGIFYDRPAGGEDYKVPDAVITLIPTPTKQFFQTSSDISGADLEVGQQMAGLFMGFGAQAAQYKAPHILVGHFNVAGSMLSNGQVRTGMDIEVGEDQIALANINLGCLGHIHLGQNFSNIFYSSSIYAVNVGEDHPHGFYIHEFGPSNFNTETDLESSRFIETPCRKIARFKFDMTAGEKITIPFDGVAGATVRIDVSAWQDEAKLINKEEITTRLKLWGAEEVDIRITPIPRVTVRAAEVLKADALRDKIQRRADLVGDVIAFETLSAADILEVTPADQLVRMVMGGAL